LEEEVRVTGEFPQDCEPGNSDAFDQSAFFGGISLLNAGLDQKARHDSDLNNKRRVCARSSPDQDMAMLVNYRYVIGAYLHRLHPGCTATPVSLFLRRARQGRMSFWVLDAQFIFEAEELPD
jgi:hypothetical protein